MGVEPDKAKRSPLPMQWWLVLIVVLCIAGGFYSLQTRRPPTAVQVHATRDLAAHTIVAANTVTLTQGAVVPGALTSITAALGHLTLAEIQSGAVITPGMLLAAPAPPPDWLIVRLPVSGTLPFVLGETVLLYGAQEGEGEARQLSDQALVLAVDVGSLTVAAPPEAVRAALGYLADGRVFAVRQIR